MRKLTSSLVEPDDFLINGTFQAGQLITTGPYPTQVPENHVPARFTTSQYPQGFGTPAYPNTHIAVLNERGQYTFTKSDFAGLDIHQSIQTLPPGTKTGLQESGTRV